MRALTSEVLQEVTQAKVLSEKQRNFSGLGTDTRADLTGQLFVALKGESFDAHDFVNAAVDKGAVALLVHQETPAIAALKSRVSVYLVDDTLKALQQLGNWARHQSKATVIGLTGSNGKTTTKEFIAAILAPYRDVHYSQGSFNNHWGVPFTLLQLEPAKEVAVIEMGMNHAGEIARLVVIADPDIVLCTMVGHAHIEHFGSAEKIAEAKEEIYETARHETTRIYNLDNEWTRQMYSRSAEHFPRARRLTFSAVDPGADVFLQLKSVGLRDLEVAGTIQGEAGEVRVAVFGAQNLTNLMAAAAAALATGLDPGQVWKGLENCKTSWGRNQFVRLQSGAEMIFDAYNANPDSMKALLDNMSLLPASKRKIGVFGQMLELGEGSADFHQTLGQQAGKTGFAEIYFIGKDVDAFRRGLEESHFSGKKVLATEFAEPMGQQLASGLKSGDVVVVKGSRGMQLERFVTPCQPLNFGSK